MHEKLRTAAAMKLLAAGLTLSLIATACAGDNSSTAPATQAAASQPAATTPAPMHFDATTMTIKGKKFSVELALSDAQTERGLMYRRSMDGDHGMLFVFDHPQGLQFWMQNTWIPLDIVFLDSTGTVVDIEKRKPMDTDAQGPKTPTQYVIELNAGTADKIGLQKGDHVDLPKESLKAGAGLSDK